MFKTFKGKKCIKFFNKEFSNGSKEVSRLLGYPSVKSLIYSHDFNDLLCFLINRNMLVLLDKNNYVSILFYTEPTVGSLLKSMKELKELTYMYLKERKIIYFKVVRNKNYRIVDLFREAKLIYRTRSYDLYKLENK